MFDEDFTIEDKSSKIDFKRFLASAMDGPFRHNI